MAKNIIINEDSSMKVLKNVNKIATKLPDDSECLWIPEDEIPLVPKTIIQDGTYVANREIGNPYGYSEVTVSGVGNQVVGETFVKSISQNGEYIANQDPSGPFYGYSKVNVNVSSYGGSSEHQTSGTVGTDSDGDEAMAIVNPQTEKIEIVKIPSRIEVITPPTNPYGVYNTGQSIEKDGMVLKAYTENGEEWGEVPLGEVTIVPNVADYSKLEPEGMVSDLLDTPVLIDNILTRTEYGVGVSNPEDIIGPREVVMAPSGYEKYTTAGYVGTNTSGGGYIWRCIGASSSKIDENDNSYTYDEKTVYYITPNSGGAGNWKWTFTPDFPQTSFPGTFYECAWTMIYGTIAGGAYGGQPILVKWKRPGDDNILSDTFYINVAPPYSTDDNSFSEGV